MTGQGAANDSQTHSIIGPIQLFVILRESQVIQVSAAASAAAVSPARLYFMILKNKHANKTNYRWCPVCILLRPPSPSHLPKPLLELVHRIKKKQKKKTWQPSQFPIMHSCTTTEQRKKNSWEKVTKALLFLKSRGAQTPWEEVKFGIKGKEKEGTVRKRHI